VRARQLDHGREISFDLLERDRAGVAGDVVRAGQDDDHRGAERDHVGAEADEELRRRLTADAAVDVGLARNLAANGQFSVIESPKNTTRFSPAAGGFSLAFEARNRLSCPKSSM
jgi:hypothetical protein